MKKIFGEKLAAVLFILLFSAAMFACKAANGKNAEISGTVVFKDFYGAPNYGENSETDKIERLPILVLEKPFEAKIEGEKISVKEIQVIIKDAAIREQEFGNKKAVVKGEISKSQTGHHHTDFVIFAESFYLKNR